MDTIKISELTSASSLTGLVTIGTDANNNSVKVSISSIISAAAAAVTVPTKTSDLTNDSGFLTQHQDISGKADKATTLAGYGITDANINTTTGVITLGNNTIKPIAEPANDGTSGQVLTTDGQGGRTWTTVSGGGGGGTITDVKVNGTSVVTSGVAAIDLTGYQSASTAVKHPANTAVGANDTPVYIDENGNAVAVEAVAESYANLNINTYGWYKADSDILGYMLYLTREDKAVPLHTVAASGSEAATTGTGKSYNTAKFDPFGGIYVRATNTKIDANSYVGSTTSRISGNAPYINRWFNYTAEEWAARKPVYLVAELQSDGYAKLPTNRVPWSQELPSTNDGYIYIFLGTTHSTKTNFWLSPNHPIYYHDGTRLYQYSGDKITGGGGSAGTLNTTNTTAQSTAASESLSGTINLHKIAKTGTYSDLIGTPTIPIVDQTYDASSANAMSGVAVASAISTALSSVFVPAGSVAFASLPTLGSSVLGHVYNITEAFTTTSDFVEGSGKSYSAGTNVAVVNTGTSSSPTYKFDVWGNIVDLSGYYTKTEIDNKGYITSHQDISGKVDKVSSSTDNAIVRFDGTGGAVQNSGVTIDDSNNIVSAASIYLTSLSNLALTSTSRINFGSQSSPNYFITAGTSNGVGIYNGSSVGFVFNPMQYFFPTDAIDLGRSTNLWGNIYFTGSLYSKDTNSNTISVTLEALIAKEDKLSITTPTISNSALTAAVGNYYMLTNVGTLAITLPTISSATKIQAISFSITTASTTAVTFAAAGSETIRYQDGWEIAASSKYEVTALWNGTEWMLTCAKFATS